MKETFGQKSRKSLNILWLSFSMKVFLLFMSSWRTPVDKNVHILAGIYFIFLKKRHIQNLKEIGPQWKDRKSSQKVRPLLAPLCKLDALILVQNCVINLRVTDIVRKIKFKGPGASYKQNIVPTHCLQNFFSLFMSLITAPIIKRSHILAGI